MRLQTSFREWLTEDFENLGVVLIAKSEKRKKDKKPAVIPLDNLESPDHPDKTSRSPT